MTHHKTILTTSSYQLIAPGAAIVLGGICSGAPVRGALSGRGHMSEGAFVRTPCNLDDDALQNKLKNSIVITTPKRVFYGKIKNVCKR